MIIIHEMIKKGRWMLGWVRRRVMEGEKENEEREMPSFSFTPSILLIGTHPSIDFPIVSFHELISCITITSKHWNLTLQDIRFWKMCKIHINILHPIPHYYSSYPTYSQ